MSPAVGHAMYYLKDKIMQDLAVDDLLLAASDLYVSVLLGQSEDRIVIVCTTRTLSKRVSIL